MARQAGIQSYGTIVFDYKGRTERVTSDAEQELTNTVIKVVSGKQRKVYFTQGHGERDTASSERDGYNAIATALGHENYTLDKVVLAQQGAVPDDAAIVVVAGPKIDFFPAEIDALKKYLDKAGKLLLELDPPDKPDSQPLTNLIALAHDWGFDVGNNIVVDASGMGRLIGTDASVPVVSTYPPHAITERFQLLTAFPLARSVTPVMGGVNGRTPQTHRRNRTAKLGRSRHQGLDDDRPGVARRVQGRQERARSGSRRRFPWRRRAAGVPAALGDTPEKAETRVVVFGDSDFVANAGLGIQGNRDLFLNTLGWLSQQENLISIRPKEADDRRLTLTATQQQNIMWLSLIIIPGFIFGSGVYTWWRRR